MAHTVFIFMLCDTNDLSEYRYIFGFQIGFPYAHRMVLHHGSAVRLLFCSSSFNAMIGLDSKVHELSSRAGSVFSNFTSKNNPKIQGLRTKCVVRSGFDAAFEFCVWTTCATFLLRTRTQQHATPHIFTSMAAIIWFSSESLPAAKNIVFRIFLFYGFFDYIIWSDTP